MKWLRGRFRWKLATLAVVALAAVGGAAFWGYTALNQAEAETQEVRWGNVKITISANSKIAYSRMEHVPWIEPDLDPRIHGLRPGIVLTTGMDKSVVVIDAETGEVLDDRVLPAERAAFDAIVGTVEVVETAVNEEPGAPWPYGSTLPNTPRERFGPITYVPLDPGAGISVHSLIGDSFEPQPPGATSSLRVFNGRSQIHVDGAGRVFITEGDEFIELTLAEFTQADPSLLEGIHPDDRQAFQRFVDVIELVPMPTVTPHTLREKTP
jgi:hypothetical protein